MKLWIDAVQQPPEGYVWCQTVDGAKSVILHPGIGALECENTEIELIDIGLDAGAYAQYGGNYIELLKWLEETGSNYPIRIHTRDDESISKMRRTLANFNKWLRK